MEDAAGVGEGMVSEAADRVEGRLADLCLVALAEKNTRFCDIS